MSQKIKKNDMVMVITGKDKGKKGTVLSVIPETGQVVVDGVRVTSVRMRRRGAKNADVIEKALPIDRSNVIIIDPKEEKPTRIRVTREEGKRVRVTVKSGTTLS